MKKTYIPVSQTVKRPPPEIGTTVLAEYKKTPDGRLDTNQELSYYEIVKHTLVNDIAYGRNLKTGVFEYFVIA